MTKQSRLVMTSCLTRSRCPLSDEISSQTCYVSAFQSGALFDEIPTDIEAQVNPKMNSASSQLSREGKR